MKLKIYSYKLWALGALFLVALQSFAQQNTDSTDYGQQMRQLQKQMSQLQRQMNQLQSKQMHKQAESLRKQAQKMREFQVSPDFDADNFKGLTGVGITDSLVNRITTSTRLLSDSILKKYKNNAGALAWAQVGPMAMAGTGKRVYTSGDSENEIKKLVQSGDVKEKIKNFSKTYPLDGNDKVQIYNSYGKVTINTWNKNEVKVDVQVKAYANEDADAQKLLDNVNITDDKESSLVSFKTHIDPTHNNSTNFMGTWFSSGKRYVRKLIIDYVVYLPATNQLQITNRYGATEIPNFTGKLVIDNAYGSLIAKSLTNPDNEINVKYGSADIEQLKGSILTVAYGSLNLGEADKLNAEISYSPVKIGKLTTAGSLNVRYSGGVQIADLDRNFKSLDVNSSYSNVRLGLNNNDNADFNVTVSYGSFNYGDHPLNIVSKTPEDNRYGWNPTQTYKGKVGKGNTDKVINIKARYGSVKFD